MANYFGTRLGQRLPDLPEGKTPFDDLPFGPRWYYRGCPWFMAPAMLWYRTLDCLPI